jgi:putative YphP/YqiW family bacilliredoxin
MYPEQLTAPMRAELTDNGFIDARSAEEVATLLNQSSGTTLLVINSVCGCAAGAARPGVLQSLTGEAKPDRLVTVFAGVDKAAVDKAREYLLPYPPSSPAIALFKDGELVHFLQRHHIEGRNAQMISENLKLAYADFCKVPV